MESPVIQATNEMKQKRRSSLCCSVYYDVIFSHSNSTYEVVTNFIIDKSMSLSRNIFRNHNPQNMNLS